MPRLELTFSESKFAACQSGTLSRVSRAFRFPDIDSRAKCVRSIKLSLIPNPNTPQKACFKSVIVEVSKLGSLHTFGESCLISHVWWILSQTTFWMDLRGRRLIYINSKQTKWKKCPVVKKILTRKQSAEDKKKKEKKLNSLLNQTGLLLAKSAQLSWKFDLEATREHTKLYRIDCSTNRAFCIYLIEIMDGPFR